MWQSDHNGGKPAEAKTLCSSCAPYTTPFSETSRQSDPSPSRFQHHFISSLCLRRSPPSWWRRRGATLPFFHSSVLSKSSFRLTTTGTQTEQQTASRTTTLDTISLGHTRHRLGLNPEGSQLCTTRPSCVTIKDGGEDPSVWMSLLFSFAKAVCHGIQLER